MAILLCVAGHFPAQPNYQDSHTVEYLLAALPFALFGLVIIAFKVASKNDNKIGLYNSRLIKWSILRQENLDYDMRAQNFII